MKTADKDWDQNVERAPMTQEDIDFHLDTLKTMIAQALESPEAKIQMIKEDVQACLYEIHSDKIAAKLSEYIPILQSAEIS